MNEVASSSNKKDHVAIGADLQWRFTHKSLSSVAVGVIQTNKNKTTAVNEFKEVIRQRFFVEDKNTKSNQQLIKVVKPESRAWFAVLINWVRRPESGYRDIIDRCLRGCEVIRSFIVSNCTLELDLSFGRSRWSVVIGFENFMTKIMFDMIWKCFIRKFESKKLSKFL